MIDICFPDHELGLKHSAPFFSHQASEYVIGEITPQCRSLFNEHSCRKFSLRQEKIEAQEYRLLIIRGIHCILIFSAETTEACCQKYCQQDELAGTPFLRRLVSILGEERLALDCKAKRLYAEP